MQPREFESFADALVDPAAPLPAGLLAAPGAVLEERFAVYRNNVFVGLIDALAARFPVTHALVGEEFFRAMAREHVLATRPTGPQLAEYGEAFADFVRKFEPAASLPWLPEVTQLERLWTQSWAAAEGPVLALEVLAAADPGVLLDARVVTHPAARLLRSSAPAGSLWQAHQSPSPDLLSIRWEAENVLVTRPGAQVHLSLLTPACAAFAGQLAEGATIESAACAALAVDPEFNLGQALAGLARDGFLSELQLPCNASTSS